MPRPEASFGGLKARDVEPTIRAHGFEKGAVLCLTKLAEYQTVIRESQMEMATLLDKVIDITANFSDIAENMHNALEATKKKDSEVSDDEINH